MITGKMYPVFFSLLRSGMYGTPIPEAELPDSIDWKSIIALARKHVVLGIIIDSVALLPEHLHPSASTMAKMNKFAIGLIQTNLILDRTAARLVTFLREHDIEGVLLKGQGVARFYRQPQMRQCGDIDFYVGRKIYKKAVALCKAHLMKKGGDCHETDQHFDFTLDKVTIELHRIASRIYSPVRNAAFQKWVEEELEHSPERRTLTVGETDISLPPLDFDAIYIFYHAWRHFITGGIGMRQICDWAMIFYSKSEDIDKDKLVKNIRRFGMTVGWKLFACIAVRCLGVGAEKIPLYDPSFSKKADKVLEDILDGGNFGYYSKANMRTPIRGFGVKHALGKLRNFGEYYINLVPLIPVEATFILFNRLTVGTVSYLKRSKSK